MVPGRGPKEEQSCIIMLYQAPVKVQSPGTSLVVQWLRLPGRLLSS